MRFNNFFDVALKLIEQPDKLWCVESFQKCAGLAIRPQINRLRAGQGYHLDPKYGTPVNTTLEKIVIRWLRDALCTECRFKDAGAAKHVHY